jgi:hypothetical protein
VQFFVASESLASSEIATASFVTVEVEALCFCLFLVLATAQQRSSRAGELFVAVMHRRQQVVEEPNFGVPWITQNLSRPVHFTIQSQVVLPPFNRLAIDHSGRSGALARWPVKAVLLLRHPDC